MSTRIRVPIDPGLCLTGFLAIVGVLGAVALPREGRPMLIVLTENGRPERLGAVLTRADANLVAVGALPGLYVVTSERPGLAARLWDAGATLVIDAALAFGCRPVGVSGDRA